MLEAKDQGGQEEMRFRVPAELKQAFEAAAQLAQEPVEAAMVHLMQEYVVERGEPEPEYDAWFCEQVQTAIDDPRPNVAHEQVMLGLESMLDGFVAEQKRA